MAYLETIDLRFAHSLLMGHAPAKLKMEQISNKLKKEGRSRKVLQSFGLFDSNQSNYNTYYPDVKAEDLVPKEEDFVQPIFRALSEVIVHKEWNPVDFTRNGVLRKSMPLLKGTTVKTDHDDGIGNSIGAVSSVFWEDSKKTNNIFIPAGVNAKLKIDGKSHPRIARAIMMKPPAIHSDSVTVQFLWEKSHPNLSEEDFFKSLGTYDKDGALITRVASLIKKYPELSLVDHGADPFAQVKDETGNINNPVYADSSYNSLSIKQKKKQKIFLFDYKTDLIANSEKKTTIPKKLINKSQTSFSMKEIIALLSVALGLKLSDEKPNLKIIKNALATLKSSADKAKGLEKANASLKEESKALVKSIAKLKEFRNSYVSQLRKETTRNYKLLSDVSNSSFEESVLTIINSAKPEALEGLNRDYKKKLEKHYPLSCNDCGSDNVTRSSAVVNGGKKSKRKVNDIREIGALVERKITRNTIKSMHSN